MKEGRKRGGASVSVARDVRPANKNASAKNAGTIVAIALIVSSVRIAAQKKGIPSSL